jgi:hypothetical protein
MCRNTLQQQHLRHTCLPSSGDGYPDRVEQPFANGHWDIDRPPKKELMRETGPGPSGWVGQAIASVVVGCGRALVFLASANLLSERALL